MLVALALFALMAGLATQTLFSVTQGYRHVRASAQAHRADVSANAILREAVEASGAGALRLEEWFDDPSDRDEAVHLWIATDRGSHTQRLELHTPHVGVQGVRLAGSRHHLEESPMQGGQSLVLLSWTGDDGTLIRATDRSRVTAARNCQYDEISHRCLGGYR